MTLALLHLRPRSRSDFASTPSSIRVEEMKAVTEGGRGESYNCSARWKPSLN